MDKNHKKKYLILAGLCLVVLAGIAYYYFFSPLSSRKDTAYVYIDGDDDIDSVLTKVGSVANRHAMASFRTLVRHSTYADHVRTGRYAIGTGEGALMVFRHMKNGLQAPVPLTVPSVRTMGRLAAELSKHLMLDSATIAHALSDERVCRKYGYDTATIACMFVPDTYDVYWNVSVDRLLDRMKKECARFWNFERTQKARQMSLTPVQVATLASIVDEETANDAEKPMVAGMYYNRLMLRSAKYPEGMPLQADPTVKYAWKRFDLHRIYHNLLTIDSPYNTYKYPGLPPGPIRIPSVTGIDAVLDRVHHNYLYMCAKEDFSGTHNFAVTYEEHLQNARRYSAALNARGIK